MSNKLPNFNPQILDSLINQTGANINKVAQYIDATPIQVSHFLEGEKPPSSKQINRLAEFFGVAPLAFFKKNQFSVAEKIDFRTELGGLEGDPKVAIEAIGYAKRIQALLAQVVEEEMTWSHLGEPVYTAPKDFEELAIKWRKSLEISNESQLRSKSENAFFSFIRSRIESLGISVLVSSFENKKLKGLVFGATDDIPVILINSYRQTHGARLFTMMHEFCHVLLGQDDLSNPFNPSSELERACNRFAAEFLMPRDMVASEFNRHSNPLSNQSIRRVAKRLRVSQEALVIRLVECGYAPDNFWNTWKGQFGKTNELPSEVKSEGGGGGAFLGQNKLSKFGYLFARSVPNEYRKAGLSASTVFRFSRLKPKYFQLLSDTAEQKLSEYKGVDVSS
ncbi:ImmA/IrrE family metallo-endopeptidase [Maritalea myrionectae]|uniref:ImmA/IrrE family metallo-endopeptidase n=1 Tax=Maritalea myrionectae TaxID=454601 RepID=UPI00041057CE|nr:ImmA/IrrE family metallo-endopeptidase [Maritalea myrionectae]